MSSLMQRQVRLYVDVLLNQRSDAAVLARDRDSGAVGEGVADTIRHAERAGAHRIGASHAAVTTRAADRAVADATRARGRTLRAARGASAAAAVAAAAAAAQRRRRAAIGG